MFSLFSPTTKQLERLYKCHVSNYSSHAFLWVDVLVRRGYIFKDKDILTIRSLHYNKRLRMNYDNVAIEKLEDMLKNIDPEKDLQFVSNIIIKNNLKTTTQCLNNAIRCINYNHNQNRVIDFLEMLINFGSIPDINIIYTVLKRNFNFCQIFEYLIKYIKPSTQYMKKILDKTLPNIQNIDILLKCKFVPDDECVKMLISDKVYYTMNDFNKILSAYTPTLSLLQYATTVKRYNIIQYLIKDKKIKPDTICLNNLINTYKYSDQLRNKIEYMLTNGAVPNIVTLKLLCECDMPYVFVDTVKKYDIIPNKSCLDAVVQTINIKFIHNILGYKIIPDKTTFKNIFIKDKYDRYVGIGKRFSLYNTKIVELLINYGLEIDIECVDIAQQHSIKIKDLSRFNIRYDEQLYYLCYKNSWWNYKFVDIDPNLLELRDLCKNGDTNLYEFTWYMKEYNIKPDRYCLEYACRHNLDIAKYMLDDLKCDPTICCLIIGDNDDAYYLKCKMMKKLNKMYKVDHILMSKPYDHIDTQNIPVFV
jgi:hypothetical protein